MSNGQTRRIQVTGYFNVTAAKGALVNLTIVATDNAGGNISAYAGPSIPVTSSVNWYVGGARVVANYNTVTLDSTGGFTIRLSGGSAQIIVDVFGYLDNTVISGGVYTPLRSSSARLYDSRISGTNVPNPPFGVGAGPVVASQVRSVPVRGYLGVPTSATAVAINITAAETFNGGNNIRFYPSGEAIPPVSSINWFRRDDPNYTNVPRNVGNFTIVKIGSNGSIDFYTDTGPGRADVVIDIIGYIQTLNPSNGYHTLLTTPLRVCDTRAGQPSYAGCPKGSFQPNEVRNIDLRSFIPIVGSVVVRLTAVDVTGGQYFAAWGGDVYPGNSNVNTTGAGQVTSNLVIVPVNGFRFFQVKNGGVNNAGLIVDILSYDTGTLCTNNERCFKGEAVSRVNTGVEAILGTTNPSTNGSSTFMFLQAREDNGSFDYFVQIGWTEQAVFGTTPILMTEGFNEATNQYYSTFRNEQPNGDNRYAVEYNSNTNYWCFAYINDPCIVSLLATNVGMTQANKLVAYGETTQTFVQMGGANAGNPILFSSIKSKLGGNWSYVTIAGGDYEPCGSGQFVCPYYHSAGLTGPSSSLEVRVWTQFNN